MLQQEDSTVPSETERIDIGQKQCYTVRELKDMGLHPTDDSLPNTNAHNHSNTNQNVFLRVEDNAIGARDGSFLPSLECRSMYQPSGDSLNSQASGQSMRSLNSQYQSEQLILASHRREQPMQNHPSFSIPNSGQFVHGPNIQFECHPVIQSGMANNQGTTQQPMYDDTIQAQPMSNEAGHGRVVTPNYSGVLKQNVPETGNPQSLKSKVNHDVVPMISEEGHSRVVTPNYSGVLKQNVREAQNPWSLHNRQLSDQNTVNYSVTSQPNSLDTATQRAQAVSQPNVRSYEHGDRLVVVHHSGEVLLPTKERLWSMENHRLNEQNISLNRSVGAPHSSQMPSDLCNDQDNQITTPIQYGTQDATHLNTAPVLDQIKDRNPEIAVGPHGFVQDPKQQQGSVRPSADMLKFRQGNNSYVSMQARDNRDYPNHPTRQGNQFIDRSRQQQPGHFGNPPGQSYQLDTAGRQDIQPMGVNYDQFREGQISDGGPQRQGKKVFILHYDDVPPDGISSVLQLAVTLRNMEVDVTLDLFIRDNPPNSWPLWYEQKIKDSDVVLCMITENFYDNLTKGSHVMGYSMYNLMNLSTIAVRAVFLNVEKKMEHVPPSMRGATCYCLQSGQLTINHEEFASLYAFLSGQNRIEKPKLGKMVTLTPRRSRFGQSQGGQRTAAPAGMGQPLPGGFNMRQPPHGGYNMGQPPHQGYNMGQPPHGGYNIPPMAANRGPAGFNQGPPPQLQFQPSGYGAPPGPAASQPDVDQANLLYSLLAGDSTAVSTVRSHNRMFQTLATKMAAEWEPLGRALGLRDPEVYAIRRDHGHSVVEQAVQMFQTWLEKNGSRATFGALTMAVYDTGMQYWNLLEILNKHTLKQ